VIARLNCTAEIQAFEGILAGLSPATRKAVKVFGNGESIMTCRWAGGQPLEFL
jgi:hypothetical protein